MKESLKGIKYLIYLNSFNLLSRTVALAYMLLITNYSEFAKLFIASAYDWLFWLLKFTLSLNGSQTSSPVVVALSEYIGM